MTFFSIEIVAPHVDIFAADVVVEVVVVVAAVVVVAFKSYFSFINLSNFIHYSFCKQHHYNKLAICAES